MMEERPINRRSLPKLKFTADEDAKLRLIVRAIGTRDWGRIASLMYTKRARQCRERWENYLDPSINKGAWTHEEDRLLLEKQEELGSKWVQISKFFTNRTDALCKNRFNRLQRMIEKGKKLPPRAVKLEYSAAKQEDAHSIRLCSLESEQEEECQSSLDEFPVFSRKEPLIPAIFSECPDL